MLKKAYKIWLCLTGKLGYIKGTVLFIKRVFFRQSYHNSIIKILSYEMQHVIEKYRNYGFNNVNNITKYVNDNQPVWVFWYQGYEKMPEVVRECYLSIKEKLGDNGKHNVHLLMKDNINDYIQIPDYIIEKLNNGLISITHFSDVLRVSLLEKYGGCWIDATCFIAYTPDDDIWNYDFYSQKYELGKANFFNEGKWATFFLMGKPYNLIFSYLKDFLYEYWKKNNLVIDYFLTDYALNIAYKEISIIKELIDEVPPNNSQVMMICEKWDYCITDKEFKAQTSDNWLFKLTWKNKIKSDNTGKETVSEMFKRYYLNK